jgi:predicted O-methyltransferase YrrM
VDTGLDDPQSKKMAQALPDRFVVAPTDMVAITLSQAKAQSGMVALAETVQMLDGVDTMVAKYSSQPSDALHDICVQTAKTNPLWSEAEDMGETTRLVEAEMFSGQTEGQLLQLLVKFGGVNKVLDFGTFTGCTSLAMAEALREVGRLVTLEREQMAAKMAAQNLAEF